MLNLVLHHVSVPTQDLSVASKFYEGVLGLSRLPRPPFSIEGIWYALADRQIHVTVYPTAHFRAGKAVDNDDIHFALHVGDFESAYAHLRSCGYDETLLDDHPQRMILKRTGLAGFPQLFIMDPDRNIIELNQAPFISAAAA